MLCVRCIVFYVTLIVNGVEIILYYKDVLRKNREK